MSAPRLPFTLTPLPGEDLHTYLASYAFHLDTTVEALAETLGFARAAGATRLPRPEPADHPRLHAAITAATGLDRSTLTALLTAPAPNRALGASMFALALRTDPPLLERTGSTPADAFISAAIAELHGPNRITAHDRLGDLILIAAHLNAPVNGPSFAARALSEHCTAHRLTAALRILTWPGTGTDPLAGLVGAPRANRRGRSPIPASWGMASPPLTRRIARLLEPGLPPAFRLRHATTAPRTLPLPRNPDPAERAARIPDQLWPAWAIRLSEDEGVNNASFRAHLAAALLLPGARTDLTDLARLHTTPVTGDGIAHQLGRLAATRGGRRALRILTELAAALDREHVPINYTRRRARFAHGDLIDPATCTALLNAGGLRPGGPRRLALVRTYLYETLTGSSIATAPQPYRIPEGIERAEYHEFTATMPASLVKALTSHARRLLTEHGIDEPLTWQPPTRWVSTTHWPGADPEATDPAPIHQAVLARRATTTEHWAPTHRDATALGISLEHLRHVLRQHPIPHAPYTPHRPGAVIADPTATTHHAEPAPDHPKRVHHVNPAWLREQYVTIGRTLRDLAAEIGCAQGVLRRHMEEHRYPLRGPGNNNYVHTGATTTPANQLPALLRAALTGNSGPQKVHRFLEITQHPSLNQAAKALGIPQHALTHQLHTLERYCGGALFHRRPHPHPIGPLTELGEQLCRQARQHLTPPLHTNE